METINNIAKTAVNTANSAVNAVWGSSEEPVSGKQGNVAAGEPYDAGNIEPKESTSTGVANTVNKVVPTDLSSKVGLGREPQHQTSHHEHGISSGVTGPEKFIEQSQPVRENTGYDNATGSIPKSTSTSHHSSSDLASGVTGSQRVIAETQPARENTGYDNSGVESTETALRPKKVSSVDTPSHDNNDSSSYEKTTTYEGEPQFDHSSSARENVSSSRDEDKASSNLGNAGYEGSGPHKAVGSSTGPNDQSKGQQDIRSPDDSNTHPDVARKRDNVDDADGGVDADKNPGKVDGPGPRPVAELAKEHGGDAGKATEGEKGEKGAAGDDEEDDGDGPQKTSHGEGTGEKYVKTSGLAADGGDFDATKPGAGREADRLLETKGVHRDAGNPNAPATTDDSAGTSGHEEHKEKTSLKDKIKDKLHRHGH